LLIAGTFVLACSDDGTPKAGSKTSGQGGAMASTTSGASSSSTSSGSSGAGGAGQGGTGTGSASTGAGTQTGSTASGGAAGVAGGGGVGMGGMGGVGGAGVGGAGVGGAGGTGLGGGGPGSQVDPKCLDGIVYVAETMPVRASITDLMSTFTVANRLPWVTEVLQRRYPLGALFVTTATKTDPNGEGNCFGIAWDASATTAQKTLEGLNTAVHECGHMMDLSQDRFMIRLDLEYKCTLQSTSPPRSIVLQDEFDALGPKGGGLDFVKMIYLQPTGTGNGGDQNFPLLFTEWNQYVNNLGSGYAYYDYVKGRGSAEGSRFFAWFVERYLRLLRAKYLAEYNKLANDTCWRQLILADWGRANRYWDQMKTENVALSTTEGDQVDKLVSDPRLLAEIENLRVLDGCRK
jgi:hypothetical protein